MPISRTARGESENSILLCDHLAKDQNPHAIKDVFLGLLALSHPHLVLQEGTGLQLGPIVDEKIKTQKRSPQRANENEAPAQQSKVGASGLPVMAIAAVAVVILAISIAVTFSK